MPQFHDSPSITAIILKEVNGQRKPGRRSLDNMVGNAVAREERTKEEIVSERLCQVIVKHQDWDIYIANDSDYIAFISSWSCHWWCWRLYCLDCTERRFLEPLDGDFRCAPHHAVVHNNLRVYESLVQNKKCDIDIRGVNRETVLHMYASRHRSLKTNEVDPGEQILSMFVNVNSKLEIDALDDELRTPVC
ncbi:unnamed protein product [Rotaria sp. Silwood1]|nr:unnamed protein product [Rotaria sp. Silwood1]